MALRFSRFSRFSHFSGSLLLLIQYSGQQYIGNLITQDAWAYSIRILLQGFCFCLISQHSRSLLPPSLLPPSSLPLFFWMELDTQEHPNILLPSLSFFRILISFLPSRLLFSPFVLIAGTCYYPFECFLWHVCRYLKQLATHSETNVYIMC